MFIAKNGEVRGVVISSNRNLVDVDYGSCLYGYKGSPWPKIHTDREAAEKEVARKIAKCNHDYRVLSHEESACYKCGDIRLMIDA